MEELIFKYLDGNASESEKDTVLNLLKTDPEFYTLFQSYAELDKNLKKIPESVYDKTLHERVKSRVLKAYQPKTSREILPVKYLFMIAGLAIAIIFMATGLMESGSEMITKYLPENPAFFTITGWLSISFLLLLALDKMLSGMTTHSKHNGFV